MGQASELPPSSSIGTQLQAHRHGEKLPREAESTPHPRNLFFFPSPLLPPSSSPLGHKYIKAPQPLGWQEGTLPAPSAPQTAVGGPLQASGGCEGRGVHGQVPPGPSSPRNSEGGGSSVWTSSRGCRPGGSLGVPSRWTTVTSAQGAEDPRPSPRNTPGVAAEGDGGLVVRRWRPRAPCHMISQQEFCFRAVL